MKTYLVECMETTTFVVEVEAQSEDEARELAGAMLCPDTMGEDVSYK